MRTETSVLQSRNFKVIQFAVFVENRLGKFNHFVSLMESHDDHILGLSVVDNKEVCMVRFVSDMPDDVRELLFAHQIKFYENEVIAVELPSAVKLSDLVKILSSAEIEIHYLYALLVRPNGRTGMILSVDDIPMALSILNTGGYKVLDQGDLSR